MLTAVSKIPLSTTLAKKVLLCCIHLACWILVHSVILFHFFIFVSGQTEAILLWFDLFSAKIKVLYCIMP